MSFRELIIDIIQKSIISVEVTDWDDASEEIISNLLSLDFCKLIENYQPCTDDELYVDKDQLKSIIKNSFVKSVGEEEEDRFITTGIRILINKQKGKYINISFSTCPNPETQLQEKDIQKIEKLIQKEKFNYLNKKGVMVRSISSSQAREGLRIYNNMLNEKRPSCNIFAYPANFCSLYYLYKSINGKIYILYSLSGFINYYQLIEDEGWFYTHLGSN
jgi:hypothetical protein